jgi:hypothetical protein
MKLLKAKIDSINLQISVWTSSAVNGLGPPLATLNRLLAELV